MEKKTPITENELPPGVLRAIEEGRKVEAIKLLREATGLGLANAKVLVDKAARQHGPRPKPPGLVAEATHIGKLLKGLLLVVIAFYVYRWFIAA